MSVVEWWQSGMVVGLLLTGCSSFVAADNPAPAPMGSGTSTAESSGTGSTSTAGTTGNGEGTGDGSVGSSMGDSVTTNEPESTDTSDSGTSDGLEGSSGSTSGAEGFLFEGTYTGSFTAICQVSVNGALSIEVDAAGVISGTASGLDQTASVTGNVDALGSVMGSATIAGLGACQLTGDIDIALIGGGAFSCPGRCTGTWILSGI